MLLWSEAWCNLRSLANAYMRVWASSNCTARFSFTERSVARLCNEAPKFFIDRLEDSHSSKGSVLDESPLMCSRRLAMLRKAESFTDKL